MTRPFDAHVKCEDGVALLTLKSNVGELDYEGLGERVDEMLNMLEGGEAKHVVVDFSETDYFGSHVIEFLLRLNSKARDSGGRTALAAMSPHEIQILKAVKLDTHWPILDSLEAALESVNTD